MKVSDKGVFRQDDKQKSGAVVDHPTYDKIKNGADALFVRLKIEIMNLF